jgi:hypothetical protein
MPTNIIRDGTRKTCQPFVAVFNSLFSIEIVVGPGPEGDAGAD